MECHAWLALLALQGALMKTIMNDMRVAGWATARRNQCVPLGKLGTIFLHVVDVGDHRYLVRPTPYLLPSYDNGHVQVLPCLHPEGTA